MWYAKRSGDMTELNTGNNTGLKMMPHNYRAIVSSDWNGCLAPCGPFDYLAYHFPEIKGAVDNVFQSYTANRISLGQAMNHVIQLLPESITPAHMDAYLDEAFRIYPGVAELIEWCNRNALLFMINTTGAFGYFERVFAKKLLPHVKVISAHPLITFPDRTNDAAQYVALNEIEIKAVNTEAIMKQHEIPLGRQILMGDSGGDGPHFKWGFRAGGFLIGCHTKPSLYRYCKEKAITLDVDFSTGKLENRGREDGDAQALDFRRLITIFGNFMDRLT